MIKIEELKEGNILVSNSGFRKWDGTVVFTGQKVEGKVEVQFISGVCRFLTESEVNEDFRSVWGF